MNLWDRLNGVEYEFTGVRLREFSVVAAGKIEPGFTYTGKRRTTRFSRWVRDWWGPAMSHGKGVAWGCSLGTWTIVLTPSLRNDPFLLGQAAVLQMMAVWLAGRAIRHHQDDLRRLKQRQRELDAQG